MGEKGKLESESEFLARIWGFLFFGGGVGWKAVYCGMEIVGNAFPFLPSKVVECKIMGAERGGRGTERHRREKAEKILVWCRPVKALLWYTVGA